MKPSSDDKEVVELDRDEDDRPVEGKGSNGTKKQRLGSMMVDSELSLEIVDKKETGEIDREG